MNAPAAARPAARLDALTALRFFAAIGVVFHHLGYGIGAPSVTFFFVLSGFILTYTYLPQLSRFEARTFASYLCARLGRIYPVHLLTFLAAIPWVRHIGGHSVCETLANLFLLQSYAPAGHAVSTYNALSWTLGNELFFYLVLPFVLAFAARTGLASRRLPLVLAALALYGAALAVALGLRGTMVAYSFTWWLVYISPYFRVVDFLIGCALGLLFVATTERAPRPGDARLFTLLEAGTIAAVILSYFAVAFKYDTLSMGLYYVPVFSLLIPVFARQRGRISALLSRRWAVHLGEISFSVYMVHLLLIWYVEWLVAPVSGPNPDLRRGLMQAAVIAATLGLSHLVYGCFENPLRRLIRKRVAAALAAPAGAPG